MNTPHAMEIGTVITIEGALTIGTAPGLTRGRVIVIEGSDDGEPVAHTSRITPDQMRRILLYGARALRQAEAAATPAPLPADVATRADGTPFDQPGTCTVCERRPCDVGADACQPCITDAADDEARA